jgi:hypothetical protein
MPLFRNLITVSTDKESLNSFLADNIQSFYDLHSSSIEVLNVERDDIRDFVEGKRLIYELLDFNSIINRSFISILFDFCERFGFASIVSIENTLNRNELSLGKRREAAKLFLLNIRENAEYLNRYNQICALLDQAIETEEDSDIDVVVTFFNYYAKVIRDTSIYYAEQLKKKILAAREQSTYSFLLSDYFGRLLDIEIGIADSAVAAIHQLIDEIYDRRYKSSVTVTEGFEFLIEQDTIYERVLSRGAISFDTVREIAVRKCSSIETHLPGRGVTPLTRENDLYIYLYRYGKMHKAKLECGLKQLPYNEIDKPIEVIDWGCGQGLASIVFNDFIKSNNIKLSLLQLILIEPSPLSLKRAALHINSYEGISVLRTICKPFDSLSLLDVSTNYDSVKIHLFSNVLDLDDALYSQRNLVELIMSTQKGINYFICCSPYITDYKTSKVDNFVRGFKERNEIYSKNSRKGEWINDWTRVLRVFKVIN